MKKIDLRRDVETLVECFKKNDLLTYASAIAFQLLIAAIPLFALSLVLLGRARAGDIWYEHVQPAIAERVTPEVYLAVSDAVDRRAAPDEPRLGRIRDRADDLGGLRLGARGHGRPEPRLRRARRRAPSTSASACRSRWRSE